MDDPDSCAMCHRAHTAPAGDTWKMISSPGTTVTASSLTIASVGGRGDTGLCLSCHSAAGLGSVIDVGTSFSQDSTHALAPTTSPFGPSPKECSSCHDPHGTERTAGGAIFPALLRSRNGTEDVNGGEAYCATCHPGNRPGNAFAGLAVFRQTKHFTAIAPPASGTGIRCDVCHEPHGSPVAPILRLKLTPPTVAATVTATGDDRTFCLMCHTDASATWSGPTTFTASGHGASAKLTSITAEWPSRYHGTQPDSRKVGECQNCHAATGAPNGSGGVVPKLGEVAGSALCYRCHAPSGPAAADLASLAVSVTPTQNDLLALWAPDSVGATYGRLQAWSHDGAHGAGLVGPREFSSAATSAASLDAYEPGTAAAGDIDGDGLAEVVIGRRGAAGVTVLQPDALEGLTGVNGAGDIAITHRATLVAVADVLPGDAGKPEIAVYDGTAGSVTLYRFAAPGVLTAVAGPITANVGTGASGIAAGDVTGTPSADIVLTYPATNEFKVISDTGGDIAVTGVHSTGGGSAPTGPSIGLVRGSGKSQVIVCNGSSSPTATISVFDGDGTNQTVLPLLQATLRPTASAVGDLLTGTGMGGNEIAVVGQDSGGHGWLDVYKTGSLPEPPTTSKDLGVDQHPGAVAIGDVTGDGRADVAVADAGQPSSAGSAVAANVQVYSADGAGTALSATPLALPGGGAELSGGTPSLMIANVGGLGSSRHPMDRGAAHNSTETATVSTPLARHVVCSDCHDSHAADESTPTAPGVPGALKGTWGVEVTNISRTSIDFSQRQGVVHGYETCLKCHSGWASLTGGRRDIAFEVNAENASKHAIERTAGSSLPAATFAPGYDNSTILYCTDCHGDSAAGQARGPHRSDASPLLKASVAGTSAVDTGMLCYRCHDYAQYAGTGIASRFANSANSAGQLHSKHLNTAGLACEACHVSHGSANLKALLRSDLGFSDGGIGSGTCSGSCHAGSPKTYPTP